MDRQQTIQVIHDYMAGKTVVKACIFSSLRPYAKESAERDKVLILERKIGTNAQYNFISVSKLFFLLLFLYRQKEIHRIRPLPATTFMH